MRRLLLSTFASFALAGCLDDPQSSQPSVDPGSTTLTIAIAPITAKIAARTASADVGGTLFVELSNAQKKIRIGDSIAWTGSDVSSFSFPSLVEGSGYSVRAWYRDPQGFTTHADSIGGVVMVRGQSSMLSLSMRVLLGKIVLNAPSLPTSVDSFALSWTSRNCARVIRCGRGTGGRTMLRLDSLPIAQDGIVRLRAWSAAGDTLYHMDTTLALPGEADLPLSLVLRSSKAVLSPGISFLPGGELDATASFSGESEQPASQSGRLVLTTFSDSGASDWIGIRNPGTIRFTGPVRLGKGAADAQFELDLPAGEMAVATRASCSSIDASHPLRSAAHIVCGLDAIVVTHSTTGGSLWKLRSGDGRELLDEVLVLDGKQSWPDLNTSGSRTARLREAWSSAFANDAGRAWCANGSDAPDGTCP